MPKHMQARAAQDEQEERQVRKLARSHHATADWKFHAQMVGESWAGKTPKEIAIELDCHLKTERIHLARFNAEGISGLGTREGAGRKPRLTEWERSRILALVKQPPPGRLERRTSETLAARDEEGSAQWTLDALTGAAHAAGIQVERSQIRRIYLREGAGFRHTHSWGTSDDKDFVRNRADGRHPLHRASRRVDDICTDELGPVVPRTFDPAAFLVAGWASHQSAAGLENSIVTPQ